MLEQNSHYQTHHRRCDEFQQFDSPNSFIREPSTSANTTNVPMTIGNENTALKAPTGNEKVNTKSIKVQGNVAIVGDSIASGLNVVIVGDSIVSGLNGKSLSTDKFTTVVCDILPCLGISTLTISFKNFLLNEWQQKSDLGVGSDKATTDHNLTNQRQNISQNVSEDFDSDLKKLKVLRVENNSNPIIAYLNINSLGEKINHFHELCKESPIDILCVDEIKLDSSYPDAQFQIIDYQFPPFRRDRNKYGGGKIVYIRQGISTRRLPKFETQVSETICVELTISRKKWCIPFAYRHHQNHNLKNFFLGNKLITVYYCERVW